MTIPSNYRPYWGPAPPRGLIQGWFDVLLRPVIIILITILIFTFIWPLYSEAKTAERLTFWGSTTGAAVTFLLLRLYDSTKTRVEDIAKIGRLLSQLRRVRDICVELSTRTEKQLDIKWADQRTNFRILTKIMSDLQDKSELIDDPLNELHDILHVLFDEYNSLTCINKEMKILSESKKPYEGVLNTNINSMRGNLGQFVSLIDAAILSARKRKIKRGDNSLIVVIEDSFSNMKNKLKNLSHE